MPRPDFGIGRRVSPIVSAAVVVLIGAGVAAAIATGANIALALLVGYGALAASLACVLALPLPATQPEQPVETILAPAASDTTAAWKLVSVFTISDASRLLCNVEPGAAATQESIAWGRALIDAIKQGDLPIAPMAGGPPGAAERERENPHYMTQVTREALTAWADQKGAVPEFLRG